MSLKATAEKIRTDGADFTWRGSSFQTQATATGKARSPTTEKARLQSDDTRVRRTISDDNEAEEGKVDIGISARERAPAGGGGRRATV